MDSGRPYTITTGSDLNGDGSTTIALTVLAGIRNCAKQLQHHQHDDYENHHLAAQFLNAGASELR
jgi:hypothetical protein